MDGLLHRSMLVMAIVLAQENDVYQDMVVKFLEQFVLIARALERQGLYDAEDAFFYDRITTPGREPAPVRVKTIAGLIPLLPAVAVPAPTAESAEQLGKRFTRIRERFLESGGSLVGRVRELGDRRTVLLSVVSPDDLARTLHEFFDEDAFLSPHGLRAVSKRYENAPYTLDGIPGATIDYEPAESTTSMFGGNSNWRGPVWLPVNYLAIRQFALNHHFFGDDFTIEYPTGSGTELTFREIAQDLADRILSIWLRGRGRPAPRVRRNRAAPGGSCVAGQPALPRVLPRGQRRRPRSDAPDRLDGARRRSHPRPAEPRDAAVGRVAPMPPSRCLLMGRAGLERPCKCRASGATGVQRGARHASTIEQLRAVDLPIVKERVGIHLLTERATVQMFVPCENGCFWREDPSASRRNRV